MPGRHGRAPPATAMGGNMQLMYWTVATVFAFISLIALLNMLWRLWGVRVTRGRLGPVLALVPLFLADILLIVSILPHHTYNLIERVQSEGHVITDGDFCNISGVATLLGLMMQPGAVIVASIQPVYLYTRRNHFKPSAPLTLAHVTCLILPFVLLTCGFVGYWSSEGDVGVYRGLYCAWVSFDRDLTGPVLLALGTLPVPFITAALSCTPTQSSHAITGGVEDRIKRLKYIAALFALSYVFLIGPLLVSAFVSVASSSDLPVEYDMVAVWVLLLKPLADVAILYQPTAPRDERLMGDPSGYPQSTAEDSSHQKRLYSEPVPTAFFANYEDVVM